MLYWLFDHLAEHFTALNVFRYLTFRGICSVITALLLSLILGPKMIRKLTDRQIGQTVRTDGPQSHLQKSGTPTMGGALIILALVISTLLWADLSNHYVWVVIFVTIGFGLIGWYDDYLKIKHKDPRGIGSRNKFIGQSLVAIIASLWLYFTAESPAETQFIFPIFKDAVFQLGFVTYLILSYLVIVGSSNAVNLTDGLDGLAIMPTVLVAGGLAVFCYLTGNTVFSAYLGIPYIAGAGEMIIFCAAIVGSGLGFLWFNTYPAQVFMGDVGALSLGAALGVVAVIARQEIALFIMGGLFVVETLSVIIQVASFKLIGKRIFRMAPLHHHFELKGWPEPRVIVRFWIISLMLVLVGLATLKLR